MFDPDLLVRDNVRRLTPYSCARDEYKGENGIFLDANENPYGTLNRYPDPYQEEVKKAVSEIKHIPVNRIFLGNGSDEIIDLCFRIFCDPGKDMALTFSPSYGMYEVAAAINNVGIIKVPLDGNFQIDPKKLEQQLKEKSIKLVLVCSPNNPTGNCMNRADLISVISTFKGIVLVDEAYIDFAETGSLLDDLGKYPNLILMQTFSKAHGMASVRVGMAFASPLIIAWFNKMKPPYNISTPNQKCILQNLKKTDKVKSQVMKIKSERKRVSGLLAKLKVIKEVFPSDANFILVRTTDAAKIYEKLLAQGIIVRNRSNVAENCIRITIGTRTENNALIKALEYIGL